MSASFFSQKTNANAQQFRRSSIPSNNTDSINSGFQHVLPPAKRSPQQKQTPTPSASTSNASYHPTLQQQQQIFADKSNRLLGLIDGTRSLLHDIRETNGNRWLVHYPPVAPVASLDARKLRRSQSFCNDAEGDNALNLSIRDFVKRSYSTSLPNSPANSISDLREQDANRLISPDSANDFNTKLNVLSLDFKLGNYADMDVVNNLEKSSIAQLLDGRIQQSLKHLDKLRSRVSDKSSKVLVTGDLNAGKSTFVNALLQRQVMIVDQQPCTSVFCEVLDAHENDGVEEAHAIVDVTKYDPKNPSTYVRYDLRHLEKVMNNVTDGYEHYTQLKIYCSDRRNINDSLLQNGIVDIALIDSPGLNRDSIKTTALFARQEEIDVVVFVVSAENHFTLSGKEFLWNAANEKAHIFIVVNRFENIRDKERCKRLILDQIKQLSPKTYEDADELVHFVSSNACLPDVLKDDKLPEDFSRLEGCLRSFVLEKRSKSKLAPAKVYLENILGDVTTLSDANREIAQRDFDKVQQELEEIAPAFEKLLRLREQVLEDVDKDAEDTCVRIQSFIKARLNKTLETMDDYAATAAEWRGFLYLWQYANEVRDSMTDLVQKEVRQCEIYAREQTAACLGTIQEYAVNHIGADPQPIDVSSMFTKADSSKHFVLHLEPMDFIDYQDKLSVFSVSVGAVTMMGGKLLGYKSVVSSLWKVSNVVGLNNMRKWVVPIITFAGIGLVIYVVSDARHAVSRKVARKLRNQLQGGNYIEIQSNRVTRESRKRLRLSAWDLQNQLQKAIEEQERKREERIELARTSQAIMEYFSSVLSKAGELKYKVEAIDIEERLIK